MGKAKVRVEDLLQSNRGPVKRGQLGMPVYVADKDGSVKEVGKLYKQFGSSGVVSRSLDQRVGIHRTLPFPISMILNTCELYTAMCARQKSDV